jgi:CubicO group peptidase (beta-lactamase class C family)
MAVAASETLRALVHKAPAALADAGLPGIAFGISEDGETAIAAAGDARAEQVFRVASITKPFVAALVLTLVQDGLLELDEPVSRYLPRLSLPAGPVTLRQLLTHQAGLEHEWSTPLADYGEGDDALDRLATGGPVPAATGPGEWFSYASAGYYVAAAACARAAGTTFESAMQARILDPLGLERTSFEGPADRPYPRARRGGGGLFSCVPDLLAFAEHLLGGPGPLAPGSLRELTAPQVPAPEGSYGLGIGIRELGGRRILEHGGSLPGFRAVLALVPDARFAFVGLANSNSGRKPIDVLRDLALWTACGLFPEEPARVEVDPGQLAAAAGAYRTHSFEIRLAPAGDELRIEIEQEGELVSAQAMPIGDGVFRISDGDEEGLLIELLAPGLIRAGGMVARRAD